MPPLGLAHYLLCQLFEVLIEYKRLLADYVTDILSHKSSFIRSALFQFYSSPAVFFSFTDEQIWCFNTNPIKELSICAPSIHIGARNALFALLEWKNRFNSVRWFITSFIYFFHIIVDEPSRSTFVPPQRQQLKTETDFFFQSLAFACKFANHFFLWRSNILVLTLRLRMDGRSVDPYTADYRRSIVMRTFHSN